MPGFQLQPGQTHSARFEIYAGPKIYHRLAQLGSSPYRGRCSIISRVSVYLEPSREDFICRSYPRASLHVFGEDQLCRSERRRKVAATRLALMFSVSPSSPRRRGRDDRDVVVARQHVDDLRIDGDHIPYEAEIKSSERGAFWL